MASELRLWDGSLERTPLIALAATAILTSGVLLHALLHTGHRVRRDRAVLRVVGMTPAQVHRSLLAQALLVVTTAILIGVPIGALVGVIAWRRVAVALGVAGEHGRRSSSCSSSRRSWSWSVASLCRLGSTRDGPPQYYVTTSSAWQTDGRSRTLPGCSCRVFPSNRSTKLGQTRASQRKVEGSKGCLISEPREQRPGVSRW